MDKAKKTNLKKYITWGCLGALVLILALMPLLARNDREEDGPQASILSGTVETGSVSAVLHGGGTLEAVDAEDITIPSGVKITEFLVANGDVVTEGTPLATVDKVTVMTAITEVKDTLEYLEEQMEDVRDETVSSSVTAKAGGRIKAVYAAEGDNVQEVMLEHGALAVLSLDSMMAVKLTQKADVATGDNVIITLSDGTEVSGRVESNLSGEIVITVEDEGYAIGEKVTVTTEGGDGIGQGELYVHNAWYATAYTGTISRVSAKEERTVSSGATLFTLTDTEFTAQYEYLASQHREYEELMQELFQMYESGTINAPCDGVISGVDKNSTHLLAAEETQWQAELLKAETGSGETAWKVILLSETADSKCTCGVGDGDKNPEHHDVSCIMACDRTVNCKAEKHEKSCIRSCDHAAVAEGCDATGKHYSDCIRSCTAADEEGECGASKYHYINCIESCIVSDGSVVCPAQGAHHSACIMSCDKTENCPGTGYHHAACVTLCDGTLDCDAINHRESCELYGVTYTAYAAKVLSAGTAIVANVDPVTVYTVAPAENGWVLDKNLNTDLMIYETEVIPSNKVTCSAGDIILIMTGTNSSGETVVENKVVVYRQSQQSGGGTTGGVSGLPGNLSGMLGGMSGMSGMFGSYGSSGTQEFELFDLEGDVLMTVTPQNAMSLTISIDEHDISKVAMGQTAQIKVNALKNKSFEAEITKVGMIGSNSGGSSKFTVELTLDKGEDMLDGMSATASIPLYTKEDVLIIPVKALAEDGAQTVVYTALDKETGEPASPVVVEIGVSDGENAEILSGLEAGDTYYYAYYDTLELSTEVEERGFGGFR